MWMLVEWKKTELVENIKIGEREQLTGGGCPGGKQGPNLPSFVSAWAGLPASSPASSFQERICPQGKDCLFGTGPPTGNHIVEMLLSGFRNLQNKQNYHVGWDCQLNTLLVNITDLAGKSDPPQHLELRGETIQVGETPAGTARSSPPRGPPQWGVTSSSLLSHKPVGDQGGVWRNNWLEKDSDSKYLETHGAWWDIPMYPNGQLARTL